MTEIHFVLQILSHVQPLNARFYPINKSDFFPGCNFHSMKISNVLLSQCNNKRRHFVICMQCLRSERNMAINLRKCFKQRISWFWRWIWNLFHPWDSFLQYFHSCFALVKILSHEWNKFHIQRQTIYLHKNYFCQAWLALEKVLRQCHFALLWRKIWIYTTKDFPLCTVWLN